jgi:Asp-tRNA(Asn)/Glu-tRNA(Gln) amidotransferase A subunit family amidase
VPRSKSEAFTIQAVASGLREGRFSSEEIVESCLARVDEVDSRVQAWAFLDRDHALAQARRADEARRMGEALGPLHGIPVGVKDIFDTADMPTEDGTVLHAGRRPRRDAAAVALLREAGAIIMGKTVTTELAVYSPGKTRNPHDPERTPGGSSSGSAAAVAAGMVPLAIGSQTNGSVIRPAAYCGVVGFKPSHGMISRRGVLHQSDALDHVGVFAGTIEDAAMLAQCLMSFDPEDAAMRPVARPDLFRVAGEEPPLPPNLAFVKTPAWDHAEEDAKAAFAELLAFLGDRATEVPISSLFDHAVDLHRTILETDLAVSFALEYEKGKRKLSARLRKMIESGQRTLAPDYVRAMARIPLLNRALDEVFDRFDAIVTPATTGEAPLGLESTGSPIFCTAWTLIGVPAITLPLLRGANGMPLGVQLIGRKGDDARLLRTAHWLNDQVLQPKKPKKRRR